MKKTFTVLSNYETSGETREERKQNLKQIPHGVKCTAVTNGGNTYEAYAEAHGGDVFDEEFGKVLTSTKVDVQIGENRVESLAYNEEKLAALEKQVKIVRRQNAKKLQKAYDRLDADYTAIETMTGETAYRKHNKFFKKCVLTAIKAMTRIDAEFAAEKKEAEAKKAEAKTK